MTTKAQMIAALKAEFPTLRVGNEKDGYTELSETEYEAQIAEWSNARLAKEAQIAELAAQATAREAAQAKLAALGLTTDDLKALGL
jgi:hypothetical protein